MQSNDTQSPLPSVEELEARTPEVSVWPTVEFLRIRMTIPGPLDSADSAVVVLDEPHDPDSAFVPDQTLHNGTPVKHPFSEEPVTYPPASSLTTTVDEFYEGFWIWQSTQHIDVESECDEKGRLVCERCGAKGPLDPGPLTVRATTKPYVTVDDWISQVYDYLMKNEDTLRKVTYTDDEKDFPEAGKLEVSKISYGCIMLEPVQEGEVARYIGGLTAEYVARTKREIEEAREKSGLTL